MPILTLCTGALLCVLGAIFYAIPNPQLQGVPKSATALIPLFVGILIAILGVAAKNPGVRKNAVHGALGLAALAALGSLMGLPSWPQILSSHNALDYAHTLAAWEQLLMFLICVIYILMGVKSFKDARKVPVAAPSAPIAPPSN